jgi:hypothetical protein
MDTKDPKTEKWLRSRPPKTELAMRYALRGLFRDGDRKRDARIQELLREINPTEQEHAEILEHSLEIRATMVKELDA